MPRLVKTSSGQFIDMAALETENEKIIAGGNAEVNARGDKIKGGKIIKSAGDRIRENRTSVVVTTGSLKGPQPVAEDFEFNKNKTDPLPVKKRKEIELPNGDIIFEDE